MVEKIWQKFRQCKFCAASANQLQHVFGGGRTTNPDYALIFINPTHQNISTSPFWQGPRFPFIGTRLVWRVLVKSNMLPQKTLKLTEGKWTEDTAVQLNSLLTQSHVYLSNVVKCTALNGDAPAREVIEAQSPLLFQELAIVKPKLIVAMGLIPFKTLAGQQVKLRDFSQDFQHAPRSFPSQVGPVVPCWFPVGRGNPKKATELLAVLMAPGFTV